MSSMDQQQAKLIKFITSFPSNVNPYLATANKLEAMVHSPPSPPWSRRLRIVLVVSFLIMFLQSVFLLYQKFRMTKSHRVKCNEFGLVILNVSITSAIGYLFYSTLTMYVLCVRVAGDWGHKPSESTMLLVFGLKFFTVIMAAWAFFWVSACQCAKIFWNSNLALNFNRDVLRNFIKWGVSISFLVAALGPLIPIAYKYGMAYKHLHQIELITNDVTSALRLKAKNYDPSNFSQIQLLSFLIPAKKLHPLQDRVEDNLRQGQILYLADICLLSLVYLPLLIISLRSLYKQSLSQVKINAAIRSDEPRKSPISRNIRRQRQRLVYHACCVYFATTIHMPMVLTQMINSRSHGFIKTEVWQEITFQGMNIPLAIVGNIILLILNLHAYLVYRDQIRAQMRAESRETPSQTGAPHSIFQKLNNIGFGLAMSRSEADAEIDIEPGDLETLDNDDSSKINEKKQPRISSMESSKLNEKKHPRITSLEFEDLASPSFGIKITQSTFSMIS